MEETRTYTTVEIESAIANYRAQQATVEKQLEDLNTQFQQLKTAQAMIQGAIIAFESLLTTPVTSSTSSPTPPVKPPSE